MQSEAERIAKKIGTNQQHALLTDMSSYVDPNTVRALKRNGLIYASGIGLTGLGYQVRTILQRFPATESRGTPEI